MQPRLVRRARNRVSCPSPVPKEPNSYGGQSPRVISLADEEEEYSDESVDSLSSASQDDNDERDHASHSGEDHDVATEEHDEDADDQENEDKDKEGDESGRDPPPEPRAAGFKDWARRQMGQSIQSQVLERPIPPSQKPRQPESKAGPRSKTAFVGPLGGQLEIPPSSLLELSGGPSKPSARPTITRRPSVNEQRMELPILAEEQAIVEAIRLYPVVIIAGETGSGKTTQVPQMLFEAGFGFRGSGAP